MKRDIILAGVGGQGILTIANVIGLASIDAGLFIKQAEVHGMSQRGGDVHSDMRISDKEIASDLIPEGKCDLIIAVEPMESLRYVAMLDDNGWLVTNTTPYVNIDNYPDMSDVMAEIEKIPNHVAIDADKIAKSLGSHRSANMVILGAASPFIGISEEKLKNAIKKLFGSKGDKVVELNLKAFEEGRKVADAR